LFSTELLDGDNTVWVQEGANTIGNVPINMMTTRLEDGLIAIATHGNGIYSSSLPVAPVGMDEPSGERSFAPAYPNPTDNQVNIPFERDGYGQVTVQVFDRSGRMVKQETVGGGRNGQPVYVWDLRAANGTSIPNGEYIVRIEQQGTVLNTQKILVNR
jgi:hypothetical protein